MHDSTPEFATHFSELAAGRLSFPWCEDCRRFHWYPMPLCPHCQSSRLCWRAVSGVGELYSWSEIHHAFDTRYSGPLPYIVALISFADAPGVRLISQMVEGSAQALSIGMAVEADFSALARGDGPLRFRPARSA
jgi:hypothetical protein